MTTLLALSPLQGATLVINTSGQHATYACNGRDVIINSASNDLKFTGYCHSVTVTGASNHLIVDSVDRITVSGMSNVVRWRSERAPVITNTGPSNVLSALKKGSDSTGQPASSSDSETVVASGNNETVVNGQSVGDIVNGAMRAADAASSAAAGAAGTVTVDETKDNELNLVMRGQHIRRDCGAGKNVNINGYQNDITLTGNCEQFALNGWGNHVEIEQTASIQVTGHNNVIVWKRGTNGKRPSTQVLNGYDNSIRQANIESSPR